MGRFLVYLTANSKKGSVTAIMKKPALIITETIFAVLLTVSVAAAGALVYDLQTNNLHLDSRISSFLHQTSDNSKQESKPADNKQNSKPDEASSVRPAESSQPEASDSENTQSDPEGDVSDTVTLRSEPKDLTEQPSELVDRLDDYGYTLSYSINGNKLIMIDANDLSSLSKAKIYLFQKSENSEYWWNVVGEGEALTDEAYISESGSDYDIGSDSNKTPGGVFSVGSGFYIGTKPDTTYPLFEITEDTYWVTDTESESYNQLVVGTEEKNWSSADHMISSEKSYKYGLVINYNTSDPDPALAGGIFMHCGSGPTEGCIAVPESIMKTILEWLDEDCYAEVFITV